MPIEGPQLNDTSTMAPNRVNRAVWPTKGNRHFFEYFLHVFGPWENFPEIAPNGAGSFLSCANPDLADMLGRTDFDLDFSLSCFDPKFPDSKVMDFPISRFLDFPIPRFPHGRPTGGGERLRGSSGPQSW